MRSKALTLLTVLFCVYSQWSTAKGTNLFTDLESCHKNLNEVSKWIRVCVWHNQLNYQLRMRKGFDLFFNDDFKFVFDNKTTWNKEKFVKTVQEESEYIAMFRHEALGINIKIYWQRMQKLQPRFIRLILQDGKAVNGSEGWY
ncbi:hypothetical protein CAEBREN_22003 [Caenorhabditis brenneri]|uniref:Uncharacterized protein n=1 Tax=Caenorhabditis brenneri TaxID=135651 RepID=G0NGC1_CAEBE|nr:hypothetical protein CAEBREN_22003 [Caenorhabditis brenneri]